MKLIEKRPYLFVVALIFVYGLYVLFMRIMRTKPQIKEGFHETPLNEISQLMKGGGDIPLGTDLKSIISRYNSTSETQSFNKTIKDIDNTCDEIIVIKKKCENDACDNIAPDDVNNITSLIQKVVSGIDHSMTTFNISISDKQLIQDNLDKIKQFNPVVTKEE